MSCIKCDFCGAQVTEEETLEGGHLCDTKPAKVVVKAVKPLSMPLFDSGDGKAVEVVSGSISWIAPGSQAVNNWRAGRIVDSNGETVKFVGSCLVKTGDSVRLHGAWEEDEKWGRQFRVSYATAAIGRNYESIKKLFEADKDFRQIGPKRAQYIVDFLRSHSLDLEDVLESDELLERLSVDAKLPAEAIEHLVKSWAEKREENIAKADLISLGVPTTKLESVWKAFGRFAADTIRDNPYVLTETIDGFGLGDADKIAKTLKISDSDPRRIVCGVMSTMRREVVGNGHTWITRRKLGAETVRGLQIGRAGDHKKASDTLEDLLVRGRLKTMGLPGIDGELVCDPELHEHEKKFAAAFGPETKIQPNPYFSGGPLLAPPVHAAPRSKGFDDEEDYADSKRFIQVAQKKCFDPLDSGWVERVSESMSRPDRRFTPSQKQIDAVEAFTKWRFVALTGAAGTGKTATVTMMLKVCEERGLHVALAAPTGKAAMRLHEMMLKAQLASMPTAATIHKLLGYQGERWTYNERCKLPVDVLVIDECFDWKQPVLTENGMEYIGNIVEKKLDVRVASRNPATGRLEFKRVVRWLKKPLSKKMLRIDATRSGSRRSGRVIRCTVNHKILTPSGYRMAGELSVGDKVIARGPSLTSEQMSVVVGSVFGDGSLFASDMRRSPQLTLVHGADQAEWLNVKMTIMGDLAGRLTTGSSGYKPGSKILRCTVNVTDEMYEIRANMTPDGQQQGGRRRWRPTQELLDMLDPLALAVWFLDNGSVNRRANKNGSVSEFATLHTERFSLRTNKVLAEFLRSRFGFDVKAVDAGRGNTVLRFSKNGTRRLMAVVRPYAPSCMSWKVSGGSFRPQKPAIQPDTTNATIRSIDTWTSGYPSVYDIEVEDHHNYVAGNIVVSNCSMIDIVLMSRLIDALPSTASVVFVGDHNQLPPVGPGAIFRDMIESELCHVVKLETVFRQAGALRRNAADVLRGVMTPSTSDEGVETWRVEDWHKDPQEAHDAIVEHYRAILTQLGERGLLELQVLSPMYDGVVGITALNKSLRPIAHEILYGQTIDPERTMSTGDKVIQTKNDYQVGIMNGDQGIVRDTSGFQNAETGRWEPGWVVDVMRGDQREPINVPANRTSGFMSAYAISVHRFQGSEAEHVIGAMHSTHKHMLNRPLIYTTSTRASKTLTLVGDREGLYDGAKRDNTAHRRTLTAPKWLVDRLSQDPSA